MSIRGISDITSKFKERYLSPLQFPGAQRSVEDRLSDLENARQGIQPPGGRRNIRVRGQKSAAPKQAAPKASPAAREEIKRVGEDHSSSLDNWHAQHSTAASDLLHTFNSRMSDIQSQTKPSTSGGWAAYNDTFGPQRQAPAPSGEDWKTHAVARDVQMRSRPTFNEDGSRGPRKISVRPKPGASASDGHAVQSAAQFTTPTPAGPRPARTYQSPEGTPSTDSTLAPPHAAAGGLGRGVQRGLFSPKDAGPKVKAVRQQVSKPVAPGPGEGQMSFEDVTPAPRAKKTAAVKPGPPPENVKMAASRAPKKAVSKWGGLRRDQPLAPPVQQHTPPKMGATAPVRNPAQFPSHDEFNSMLNDVVNERKK